MGFAAPALGAAGILSNLAGGFVSGQGTLQTGRATQASDMFQAQVAANNAVLANEAADRALASGTAKSEEVSLKSAANLGAIKAGQAAGGIDVNTGSAVTVQESAREMGKLATERTMNNAQEQAWGYRSASQSDIAQAEVDVQSGNNAMAGARMGALAQEAGGLGTGMLGAATALSPKWEQTTGSP